MPDENIVIADARRRGHLVGYAVLTGYRWHVPSDKGAEACPKTGSLPSVASGGGLQLAIGESASEKSHDSRVGSRYSDFLPDGGLMGMQGGGRDVQSLSSTHLTLSRSEHTIAGVSTDAAEQGLRHENFGDLVCVDWVRPNQIRFFNSSLR